MTRITVAFVFLFFVIALRTLTAATFIAEKKDQTFTVKDRPRIVIRNGDGRTILNSQPGSSVKIHVEKEVFHARDEEQARKEAAKITVQINQMGNTIEVISKQGTQFSLTGMKPRVLTHINVTAPPDCDLVVHAADGETELAGFSGRIEVKVSDGRLTASQLKGSLQLNVADGELRISNCSGDLDFGIADGKMYVERCSGRMNASAADGTVRVNDFSGQIEAKASDGKLLIAGKLEVVRARTSDGTMEIRAEAGSQMTSDWLLQASDGDILLSLPQNFSADVDLHTGDGKIVTQIPVAVTGSMSRREVSGKIGQGGRILQIETADGDISIFTANPTTAEN